MPPCLSEIVVKFAHSRSQKPLRFPATQKRIVTECQYTFSQQSAGRHNTLDFAGAKSCAKWSFAPFGNPRFLEIALAIRQLHLSFMPCDFSKTTKQKAVCLPSSFGSIPFCFARNEDDENARRFQKGLRDRFNIHIDLNMQFGYNEIG